MTDQARIQVKTCGNGMMEAYATRSCKEESGFILSLTQPYVLDETSYAHHIFFITAF